MEYSEKMTILKTFQLFRGISERELSEISNMLEEQHFTEETTFVQQDSNSTAIYLIYEGAAKIYRLTTDGEIINVGIVGKGDIVGEMAYIDEQLRSAFIEAIQDVAAFTLSAKDFDTLLHKYPVIAINLLRIFSQRLRSNNKTMEEVMSKDLTQRTWYTLQTLSKYFPNNEIILTQEELAEIIGATRARITESLNSLQEEGKISLAHRKITIS